jgi:hypothetical protein
LRTHGFARARCGDCGHDYFVAFSCKGRGVCPSCTTRRMVETAAHLTDHVFPRLAVRQWVLSVPKRLRYYMQRDGPVLNMVLRIFLRVIAQNLQAHCPGAADADKAKLHIGAVAFIHRFGSSLNQHVHFHVCVVDGVFEAVVSEGALAAPGVNFHPASGINADTVAPVQTTLQKRILRAFVGRGLLENCDAKDMLAYQHSGFSVDAGVCIEAHDRAALERLLRYCARPPFSMERLRKEASKLVYRCAKQRSEPASDKRGAKADELTLTPLELIDRIAALVPPPRTHRHRYFGVLAPNSPLRAAVTALAQLAAAQPATVETAQLGAGVPGVLVPGNAAPPPTPSTPEPGAPIKRPAHYLWAVLIARIYEFSRCCVRCAVDRCASSPSSPTVSISAKYSNTSGQIPSRPTSRQHVGHRCGKAVMRRWMMVCRASRIGILRHSPYPTTRWTSASVGDSVMRRYPSLGGAAACAPDPNASCLPISGHGAASERSNCLGRTCFEVQNACHT